MCRVVSCRVVSFKCAKKQSLHTKHGKECVNLLTSVDIVPRHLCDAIARQPLRTRVASNHGTLADIRGQNCDLRLLNCQLERWVGEGSERWRRHGLCTQAQCIVSTECIAQRNGGVWSWLKSQSGACNMQLWIAGSLPVIRLTRRDVEQTHQQPQPYG